MNAFITRHIIFIAFCLTLFTIYSARTMAAGFDCKQAQTEIETTICTDQLLSALDGELSRAYHKLLETIKEEENRKSLVLEQRYWLKEIRNRCNSRQCLVEAYSARLSSFMPSACRARDKEFEFTENAVAASQERPQHIASHICTQLHYVTNNTLTAELVAGFNQNLRTLGQTHEIASCQRILEVAQVRTRGSTRRYQSYGAICQVGQQQMMMCDYPMVGKFTLTGSFTANTRALADFTLRNCPLGG